MKKMFMICVCFGYAMCSIAQEIPAEADNKVLTREEYLSKSKSQRTGAIVLSVVGGAAILSGVIITTNELGDDLGGILDPDYKDENNNETLSGVLIIGGLAALGGSVPLYISSAKNRRRAINVSFKNERTLIIDNNAMVYRSIPSIGFTIPLH